MVRSGVYPAAFKTSRIIPLLKRNKDKSELDSFRPVNNVNPLAKCLDGLMKKQMDKFFEQNKVMPYYHHGSRKGSRGNSAIALLLATVS